MQSAGLEAGSRSGDPQFVNAGIFDYHIPATSPAVDAGSPGTTTVDLENRRRPFDGNNSGTSEYDIGAFEYSTEPPVSGNQAPYVNVGADQIIDHQSQASLRSIVTDDGLPFPTGNLTFQWVQLSGPAPVIFANATNASTSATFSQAGVYVLRLTANDGALATFDEVQVTVNGAGPGGAAEISGPRFIPCSDPRVDGSSPLICYDTPGGHVTLDIYTRNGKKVKTLVNTEQSNGSYTIRWDGKNESGDNVSSGVYVVRMKVGDKTLKTKVAVIK
jgi:hypothetical protein